MLREKLISCALTMPTLISGPFIVRYGLVGEVQFRVHASFHQCLHRVVQVEVTGGEVFLEAAHGSLQAGCYGLGFGL